MFLFAYCAVYGCAITLMSLTPLTARRLEVVYSKQVVEHSFLSWQETHFSDSLSFILKIPVFPQFWKFKIKSSMTFIFPCITLQNTAITLQSLNGFIDERLHKGTKQRRNSFFVVRDQLVSSFQTSTSHGHTCCCTHPEMISINISVSPFNISFMYTCIK